MHLIYYLCLICLLVASISNFQYLPEFIFGLMALYLIIICVWRPYLLVIHNFGIIFNQSCVFVFTLMILISENGTVSEGSYSLCSIFL